MKVPHCFLALGVAVAVAEPALEPSLIGLHGDSEIPASCRGNTAFDALTDSEQLAITMCAARTRLGTLAHLAADTISVTAIEQAVAPSLATLAKIARGDDRPAARDAYELTAEVYVMMAARLWHEVDADDRERVEPDVNRWLAHASAALAAARQLRRPPAASAAR